MTTVGNQNIDRSVKNEGVFPDTIASIFDTIAISPIATKVLVGAATIGATYYTTQAVYKKQLERSQNIALDDFKQHYIDQELSDPYFSGSRSAIEKQFNSFSIPEKQSILKEFIENAGVSDDPIFTDVFQPTVLAKANIGIGSIATGIGVGSAVGSATSGLVKLIQKETKTPVAKRGVAGPQPTVISGPTDEYSRQQQLNFDRENLKKYESSALLSVGERIPIGDYETNLIVQKNKEETLKRLFPKRKTKK